MRRLVIVLFAAVAISAMPPVAGAQQATPPAGADVPAPQDCTVAPRTFDDLLRLAATPVASPLATVPANPTPFAMPDGKPADEATADAVKAAIHEWVACINAGDFWRLFALDSDGYVARYLASHQQLTADIYHQAATPAALPPGQQIAIVAFRDIRVLADGRVAALVVGDDPTDQQPPTPTLFYLIKAGDRWQIDGFVPVRGNPAPTP